MASTHPWSSTRHVCLIHMGMGQVHGGMRGMNKQQAGSGVLTGRVCVCAVQSGGCSKGPHKAAMEEAARAATVKPTQHVVFKAACKVEAPQRPGVARPLPALVGRRRLPAVPAKKEGPELNTEVGRSTCLSKSATLLRPTAHCLL